MSSLLNKKPGEMMYTFKFIENCNMCNANGAYQKKIGRRLNSSNGVNPNNKIGITTTVMKCKNCDLIYANPLPIPKDIGAHYDVPVDDYYNQDFLDVAETGLHYTGQFDFINIFKEYHKSQISPTVLDIGAGIGSTLLTFKQSGFDIYGLEPSSTFSKQAKEYLKEDFSNFKVTKFEDADYTENQFDFIYSFNVLEHVYDPSAMISQALKWLKPGGLFGIVVPSSNWLTSKFLNFYYKLRGTDFVTNISPMHSPFHLYEFSLKSFQENSKVNNYGIYKAQALTTTTLMPKLLDPLLLPLMRITNTGLRIEVIIQKK